MNKEEQIDIAIEYMKEEMINYFKTTNIAFESNSLLSNQYFFGTACGYKNSLHLLGVEVRFEYENVVDGRSYVKSIEIDGVKKMMGDLEESCEGKKVEEIKL